MGDILEQDPNIAYTPEPFQISKLDLPSMSPYKGSKLQLVENAAVRYINVYGQISRQ